MESVDTSVCCQCGKELQDTQFYKSSSLLYANKGRIPICKTCFGERYSALALMYKSGKRAMQRMCMAFDIYYSDALFEKMNKDDEKVIGNYMKQMNIKQHASKTFENNIIEGFKLSGDRKYLSSKPREDDEYDEDMEISDEDRELWGDGYPKEEYIALNKHYKRLKASNPRCTDQQEIAIQDLCLTKIQQMKCYRNNDFDNYKKLGDYYTSTISKSGLKITNTDSVNTEEGIGVWAGRIAQFTPEEYYKDKKLYKDVDGFMDYWNRFIVRPLKNLMFGTQDRDKEFSVKDEENDVTEEDDEQ